MTRERQPCDVPLRLVVAGGGVAALEAVVALDALAPGRVAPLLVSASEDLVYRPMEIGEPFGFGRPQRHPLAELCPPLGAQVLVDAVRSVDPVRGVVHTAAGCQLPYDALLVAVGAEPMAEDTPGVALTGAPGVVDAVLADLACGAARHLAVVVPEGVAWTLPAYELALLTAALPVAGGARPRVTVVTHEPAPLDVFGVPASAEVARLLAAEGVEVVRGSVAPAGADRIVRLPRLRGRAIDGLPADAEGFLPVDERSRVAGVERVFAAGDGTSQPIKQGGLAAQQADAAAEEIARMAGAAVERDAVVPALRGMLRTGAGPRYLRAELADPDGTSTFAAEPLWWPPSKIASRWLAPHLTRIEATRRYGAAA